MYNILQFPWHGGTSGCKDDDMIYQAAGWQKLAGFWRAQKMPSILSLGAFLLIRDKKLCFSRNTKIATKKVAFT